MYKWLFIILATFAFGCKKNKEKAKMFVSGVVSDNSDGTGVNGASLKVYYKPYENGVFSSSYSLLTSVTTGSNGAYSFEVEKPNTNEFKFIIEDARYFPVEKFINSDNITTDGSNTVDIEADPSCTVQFHVKNATPFDNNDHLQLQTLGMNYSCSICCNTTPTNYSGMSIDQYFSCMRYAKRYLVYQYYVTKNGSTSPHLDSVYCPMGTTVNVDLFY